ncbi:MAG: STAS domain-containing protein [Planctomycetota bacterium]
MIKLTIHSTGPDLTVVRIVGRLDATSLSDAREFFANPHPPLPPDTSIDLSGLIALDAPGRRFLLDLRSAGHKLVGGSLYINQLLMEPTP